MKVNQNTSPTSNAIDKAQSANKRDAVGKGSLDQSTTTQGRSGTSVEISDTARLMKQASDVAHSQPEIRANKVLDLKKRISDGSYKIDATKIADKLVEEHLLSDFGKNSV